MTDAITDMIEWTGDNFREIRQALPKAWLDTHEGDWRGPFLLVACNPSWADDSPMATMRPCVVRTGESFRIEDCLVMVRPVDEEIWDTSGEVTA